MRGGRYLVAWFDREESLLSAARACRARGWTIVDAYTPYAVHGLDEALGLGRSRLTRACLAFGLAGLLVAWSAMFWTSAVDWPIDVGGKPWNSWPAFLPVAFELTVLFAGVGSFFALLVAARLAPWRKAHLIGEGVTNDRYALVLEETDAAFEAGEAMRLLHVCGAVAAEEREGLA